MTKLYARLSLATPAGKVTAPSDRAGLRGKLTVINGEKGPRLAKLTAKMQMTPRISLDEALYQGPKERSETPRGQRCWTCKAFRKNGRKRTAKCEKIHEPAKPHRLAVVHADGYCMLWDGAAMAVKSEAAPPLIVPVERLRFRGRTELVKASRFGTLGELRKKLPYSALPLTASTHGAAPVWERQPVPDFADIYFQPESDKRNKLMREHQDNRRRADAARNVGVYSFHGEVHAGEPQIRYDREATFTDTKTHGVPHQRQKKALVIPKKMTRLAAGSTDQGSTYETDEDEDEEEKRKRKLRFIARRKRR